MTRTRFRACQRRYKRHRFALHADFVVQMPAKSGFSERWPCALLALADQGRAAAGKAALGTAGPTEAQTALYGLSAGDFHDVTTGSNGFAAGLGYDLVIGLGTPVVDRLVPDLVSYAGGPASATPVAPIASSGLVLNVNATNGAGAMNAVARAAELRVFAAEIVTGPAHTIAPAAGTTPAPAIATPAPTTEHETSHGTGTREMSPVTAVPVAVPPEPTADARSKGSLPSWSGVILDASSAFGVLPAGAVVGLRPEMSADGGSDLLLGGRGDDLLVGGEGRNLLVGGYSDSRAAQDAVMAEDWAADCRGEGLHFFDSYFFRDGDDGADLADGQ
jgi:hypothetical protein